MATTDQIKRLVQAHYAGNEEAFRTCVLQIAAYEAKRGHSNIAAEIKELLNTEGAKRTRIINLAHQDGLFGVEIPSTPLDAVVLSDSSAERVGRVLTEYRNRKTLANHGFSNRRKILLEGLPGTGKTMTASAIATELELPLYTVQVDKLITKYMGETSARLRQIFDAIANTSGVFFFDEFDAIGADRNLDNDVGEMRRILNSFLQFIESDKTQNIIIAATNNAKLLDPALFRRFDDVLHYELPSVGEVERLVVQTLGTSFEEAGITETTYAELANYCQADIVRICRDALKDQILFGTHVNDGLIQAYLEQREIGRIAKVG